MKLYQCSTYAIDYEPTGIVVALSEKEAEEKFKIELEENDVWHSGSISVNEINVDGYEIILKKIEI